MKLLHICSYYIGNKLYKNLVRELSEKGIEQEVFVPVREKNLQGVNALKKEEYPSVHYYYTNIIKKHHRYFYFQKIRTQQKVLENEIFKNPEKSTDKNKKVDLIHAHTIFTDGGTAYRIHKKYGTPYIVSVRGTDINRFYKKGIHLRPFMYKILKEAKAVVFISHAYKNYLLSMLPKKVVEELKAKAVVIPNGIESHWLEDVEESAALKPQPEHENVEREKAKKLQSEKAKKLQLEDQSYELGDSNKPEATWLYIGALNENKNVGSLLEALSRLKQRGRNMHLKIIGSGPLEEELKTRVKALNIEENVTFHGYIAEPEKIRTVMKESDLFVMASFRETFGLVYVEAMSQGLPILYSKDRGFDGFYEEGEVGYSVDPEDPKTIEEGVEKILKNYETLKNNGIKYAKDFNWQAVAEKMCKIYEA